MRKSLLFSTTPPHDVCSNNKTLPLKRRVWNKGRKRYSSITDRGLDGNSASKIVQAEQPQLPQPVAGLPGGHVGFPSSLESGDAVFFVCLPG